MLLVRIKLKKIQTYLTWVPRLKYMLGANALLAEFSRKELTKLYLEHQDLDEADLANLAKHAVSSKLSAIASLAVNDPMQDITPDDLRDEPILMLKQGILSRDAGRFFCLFRCSKKVETFIAAFRQQIQHDLAEVQYDIEVQDLSTGAVTHYHSKSEHQTVLGAPFLQLCGETGQRPAVALDNSLEMQQKNQKRSTNLGSAVAQAVLAGNKFYDKKTNDFASLMDEIYHPIALNSPTLKPRDENNFEHQANQPSVTFRRAADLAELAGADHLALIQLDGNSIGQRSRKWREDRVAEPEAAAKTVADHDNIQRAIQQASLDETFFYSMRVAMRRALEQAIGEIFLNECAYAESTREVVRPYQILMLGGDDLLFVCQGRFALPFVNAFATALASYQLVDGKPMYVSAGVAIAKPTFPFSQLHQIASELADIAKAKYRFLAQSGNHFSVADWHRVTASQLQNIQEYRLQHEFFKASVDSKQYCYSSTRRPYLLGDDENVPAGHRTMSSMLADTKTLLTQIDQQQIGRGSLRALRSVNNPLRAELAFLNFPDASKKCLTGSDTHLWQPVPVPSEANNAPLDTAKLQFFHSSAFDMVDLLEILRRTA